MGHTQATGMVEAVQEGLLPLTAALEWHLTANHYPSLPRRFVPVCLQAIELVQSGEGETLVTVPTGRRVAAGVLVEALHLEPFAEEIEHE